MTSTTSMPPEQSFIAGDYLVYGENIEIRIETITPDRARELLGNNTANRNARPSQVRELVEAIMAGDWMFNGAPIRVAADGRLLDGQHRLLAIVKSDRPLDMLMVYGTPEAAQATMDIGSRRSAADWLRMRGVKEATSVAASLVLLRAWMTNGVIDRGGGKGRLTPQEADRLLSMVPDLPEYVVTGTRLRRLATQSTLTAVAYILHKADPEAAPEFFDGLATGAGLLEGDARLALRNRLRSDQDRLAFTSTVDQAAQAWFVMRAWNFWRSYKSVVRLQLPRGGGTFADPDVWDSIEGDELRFSLAEAAA